MSRSKLVAALGVWILAATTAIPANAEEDHLKPITDPATNSPKEALRKALFKDTLNQPSCLSIKVDPRGNLKSIEPDLDRFVGHLLKAVKKKDDKALQALFHRRLKVDLPAIGETLAKLDVVYGKPVDVSVLRLWALNTVDGSPTGLPCAEDNLTIFPHYGYPLHFGLWLQVMGQQELGRIYVSIVPADGHWNIGAFHVQQWTHASKDFASWTDTAIKTAHIPAKEAAYVQYDIAAKLVDGGPFYDVPARADILKARDALMSKDDWDKAIRGALQGQDVVYTSTLLVVDGAGVLARVRVPAEISVVDMQSSCAQMAVQLGSKPWAAPLQGMRCAFLMPKEDPKREGAMGGVYTSFADARAYVAKKETK